MPSIAHASTTPAQGHTLDSFYSSACGREPCTFTVNFGNPTAPGVKYCEAYHDAYNQCIPDGNEFKGQNPDVRPPRPISIIARGGELALKPTGGLYVTESGIEISSSEDMEPSTILMRVPMVNSTTTLVDRDIVGFDEGDGDEWDGVNNPIRIITEVVKRKIR